MKKEDFTKAKDIDKKIEKLDREKKEIQGLIFDIENDNRIDIQINGENGNYNYLIIPDLIVLLQSEIEKFDNEILTLDAEITKI